MKKSIIIIISLFMVISLTHFAGAVYKPEEITDDKIEDWIKEAEDYTDEGTLQTATTNHDVTEITSEDGEGIMLSVVFYSPARKILEDAHEKHKKYKEPSVEEMKDIVSSTDSLEVVQALFAEDKSDPEDMHLVFAIEKNGEEKIIQPENTGERDTDYQDGKYWSIVEYNFDFDDLPSHEEYKSGDYEIKAKFISGLGENEMEIKWDEIR